MESTVKIQSITHPAVEIELRKMTSTVLIILAIAVTALVESYPSPGYINRFERSANPEPQGFGGFGGGFGGFSGGSGRGYDFSYHPPAPSPYGSGGYFQPASRPTFNIPERPSPNSFNFGPAGRSGLSVDFGRRLIDHDRGTLDARASAQLIPDGSRLTVQQPSIGLQGTYHPTPQGTISANVNKILDGPGDHRLSYGLGYEHTVLDNKNGKVTVSAGVQKSPGQDPTGIVRVGTTFR